MPISETEVKRTLATYRPKDSRTILQFKRSRCDDEKLARLQGMLEQVANVQAEINSPAPPPSIKNLPRNLKTVTFGYVEHPSIPATTENRKGITSVLWHLFGPKCSQMLMACSKKV